MVAGSPSDDAAGQGGHANRSSPRRPQARCPRRRAAGRTVELNEVPRRFREIENAVAACRGARNGAARSYRRRQHGLGMARMPAAARLRWWQAHKE